MEQVFENKRDCCGCGACAHRCPDGAIAMEPDIILFDEPTSALDPELIGETLELMKNVAKRGITMLVVTHELSFAQDIADKVIFMDGGVVVEEGTPSEVFSHTREERTKKFLARLLSAKTLKDEEAPEEEPL